MARKRRHNAYNLDGTPRYVRVYDAGPDGPVDRYTVVFSRLNTGWCHGLAMSGAPFHPQGFGQHFEYRETIDRPRYSHIGKKIAFVDIPADCQRCVMLDYVEWWGPFVS